MPSVCQQLSAYWQMYLKGKIYLLYLKFLKISSISWSSVTFLLFWQQSLYFKGLIKSYSASNLATAEPAQSRQVSSQSILPSDKE